MNNQGLENMIILLHSFKEKYVQLWGPKQEKVHTESMLHLVLVNTSLHQNTPKYSNKSSSRDLKDENPMAWPCQKEKTQVKDIYTNLGQNIT